MSHGMRPAAALLAVLVALPSRAAGEASSAQATAVLEVRPAEATVGDRIEATLRVEAPAGWTVTPPEPASELGPFTIASPSWEGPVESGGRRRWTWKAGLAAFKTGDLEIPPVEVRATGPAGVETVRSLPVHVRVRSVLPPAAEGGKPPAIADIKPPASVAADYRPLYGALGILALLGALSAVAWWLHRRYASRLAAVPAPPDPFRRKPPHVWAYAELEALLARRLPEEGNVALFFTELSRILKTYLGGRFRVDLMERTTEEVPQLLKEAGVVPDVVRAARSLLERADRVKFAREAPPPAACREAVEEAYRIVDATKPSEAAEPAAQEGAA